MKLTSKRRLAVLAAAILLGLFLVRPGVSRLKTRITVALSRAIARPVDIGSVHLRFLPQPGFDLDNLVVYEDAAFGSEPMLRASEVTAVVRIPSLLRGRLDIARLELTEPSVNLVRRDDGRWNWQSLLERTAQTPLAPTAKAKSEARVGFPYIEASSGRINFKAGQEKKPYALLNADFALWQESENSWGARLKAEPLRSDMSISDTGLLRVNGTWQRAATLRETPLQVSMEWKEAQLGQLTKLLFGSDKGWRGGIRLNAILSGTPGSMQVSLDTSVQDFHRYDISSVQGMQLAAHCDGRYSTLDARMHEIDCRAPVGNGMLALRGEAGFPGVHKLDLALSVNDIPVSSIAALGRRAKKNLPTDLTAAGVMRGNFSVKEDENLPAAFEGHGEVADLQLRSANTNVEFTAANVPLTLNSAGGESKQKSRRASLQHGASEALPDPKGVHLEYGPFPVALGRPMAAQARGWLSRTGYAMAIRGEAEIAHTLRLADMLGLPALHANAEGTAQMDLQIAGPWAGNATADSTRFAPPAVTGNVQLRNVRARLRGNDSIEILSANLRLAPDEARLEKLTARAADADWNGSVSMPRGCGSPDACLVRFNLNTDDIGLTELSEWLSPQPSRRSWYQLLATSQTAPFFLQNLTASGRVNARRLRIHGVAAEQLSAEIDLDHGKLKLSNLHANLFGGKYRGDWRADFSASPPEYAGTGTFTAISLQQADEAMNDSSIAGNLTGIYQISASGANAAAFWKSAEGELEFNVRDALFSHINLTEDESPLRVGRWAGEIRLKSGTIEIGKNHLTSSTGVYEVNGTACLDRTLNLELTETNDKTARAVPLVYSVTGTLAKPLVAVRANPETQAKLKQQ